MDAAFNVTSPESVSKVQHQASPNTLGRRNPVRKRADTAPAHIMKEVLIGPGIQRLSKINPKQYGKRTRQTLDFYPRHVYTQGPTPESWGRMGKDNVFQYTPNSELKPGLLLSVEQLRFYLFEHPLHTDIHGRYNPRNSGLRLWLQRNPADSKRRYGHISTSRCRLSNCVADLNLISQASYRVCFDERHLEQEDYNPMHNAGYCHLYCLEKFTDFPRICATLNVRVEDRVLRLEPGGKNRMMFSSIAETRICQDFINACQKNQIPHTYSRQPHWRHEGSLCHMLAREKIAHEPKKVGEARIERGARACFSKHLGNLEIENADRWVSRRTNRGNKRKYESNDEEDDDEEEITASPSKKKSKRPAKPTRAVSEVYEVGPDEESDNVVVEDDDDEYQPEPTRGRKDRW